MTVAAYSYWPTSSDAASTASSSAASAPTGYAPEGYWPASTDGTADGTKSGIWKEAGGASFHDLLDVINPLQHLPVVGTVYRWLTGDEPGNLARVVGDGLYGGPVGAITGLFNAISRDGGEDMGERIMTWAFGPGHSKSEPDQGTAIATASPGGDATDKTAAAGTYAAKSPAPVTATKLADLTPPQPAAAATSVPSADPARSVASAAALYRATDPASHDTAAATPVAPTTVAAAGSTRSVASVAALYRATDPAARGSTAVAAVKADHAPMPLVRTAAATATATAATADGPAHQLSAENAMLQRQISAGRAPPAPGQPQLVNTPVPLQLTGQSLPVSHPRILAAPAASGAPKPAQAAGPAAPSAPSQTAEATKAPPLAPAAPADLAVGTPAEISQKMMSALDKYMRLQQQQGLASTVAARGQIDVSP